MTWAERRSIERQIRELDAARAAFILGVRTKPAIVGGYTFKDELECEGRLAELASYLKEAP